MRLPLSRSGSTVQNGSVRQGGPLGTAGKSGADRAARGALDWEALPLLLSIKQAAALLGVSEATGHRWAAAGELVGAQRLGHRWYVRREVLRRWLEGRPDAPDGSTGNSGRGAPLGGPGAPGGPRPPGGKSGG